MDGRIAVHQIVHIAAEAVPGAVDAAEGEQPVEQVGAPASPVQPLRAFTIERMKGTSSSVM